MQLLQPIWLYAIAGIVIPVMIHLWNIRSGKTLPVGSIALLKENGKPQSRRLKLSELLLLLLRCILIILLALLLSKPAWRRFPSQKEKGWLLVAKEKLPETYSRFQPAIDSLLKAGYTFHYFSQGFPADRLETALQRTKDSLADSTTGYWSLLAALQQQGITARPVFIFTPNYLNRFQGQRPVIDTNVHWYAYTPADSLGSWWADAYETASGNIRAGKVTSTPAANTYTYEEQPAAISLKADTATTQITIFADTYAQDARYLKAAMEAIRQFTQRKMQVSVINRLSALPTETDWLFWLSPQAVPQRTTARNVWQYDSGKVVNNSSWIISAATAPIPLYKRTVAGQVSAADMQTLWQDGFGNALLRLEKQGDNTVYHFSSRLDPAWNDLPWNAAFPALLLQLLFPDSSRAAVDKDRRAIAAQQLQPDPDSHPYISRKNAAPVTTDLSPFFWAAVLALFFTERLLVFKKQKLPANG